MPQPIQLLIVDDEPDIRNLIQRYFSKQGYQVFCASSGQQMRQALGAHPIDIVLLDVCLPDTSGFDLLPQIKAQTNAAVIMLTVQANTEQRVAGLNQGADDYLPKPFDLSELQARINAVLRRNEATPAKPPTSKRYQFEGYILDTRTRKVTDPQTEETRLSPAEYELLLVFVKHAGVVLDRDYLMLATRGRPATVYDRSIDVRLSQLRKKIVINGPEKPLFVTIRGGGYMLDCDVEIDEAD